MIAYNPIPGRIIDLIYAQMLRYDYSGCLRMANEQNLFVEDRHRIVRQGLLEIQPSLHSAISVLFTIYRGDSCFNRLLGSSKALFRFKSVQAFLDWILRVEPTDFLGRVLRIFDRRSAPLAEYQNRLRNNSMLLSLIRSFELEEKHQFYLLNLCLDRDRYLKELHQSFTQCVQLLEQLEFWNSGAQSLNTAKNMDEERLYGLLDRPVEEKEAVYYSICMLPDGLMRVFDRPGEREIIIGCNACSPLDESGSDMADLRLIGNALSEQRRLDILSVIRGQELYATEIANELHVSNNTLFYHMNMLCEAKLLTTRTAGRKVFYSIDPQTLKNLSIYFDRLYRRVIKEQRERRPLEEEVIQSAPSGSLEK